MKKVQLSKKLSLNKEIVSGLSDAEKMNIKGGDLSVFFACGPTGDSCDPICGETQARACMSFTC